MRRVATPGDALNRRGFLLSSGAAVASAMVPWPAAAAVPRPYDWNAYPPLEVGPGDAYIAWMVANRGEDPIYLGEHWRAT